MTHKSQSNNQRIDHVVELAGGIRLGTYLALLPFESGSEGRAFSYSVLECIQRSDLFERIRELIAVPVPRSFDTYFSRRGGKSSLHGNTQTDRNGEPLTRVRALQLLPFASHESVGNSSRNKAIWAYLAQLPPKTWVALYWR